jgi:hypothetical protein
MQLGELYRAINLRVNRITLHNGGGCDTSNGNNGNSGEPHFELKDGVCCIKRCINRVELR